MKPRLGRIVQHDDLEQAYREDYYASGRVRQVVDHSAQYDFSTMSDDDLARAERWARYYVQSGLRRSDEHRWRAMCAEQQRRRIAANEKARQVREHQAGDDPSA